MTFFFFKYTSRLDSFTVLVPYLLLRALSIQSLMALLQTVGTACTSSSPVESQHRLIEAASKKQQDRRGETRVDTAHWAPRST